MSETWTEERTAELTNRLKAGERLANIARAMKLTPAQIKSKSMRIGGGRWAKKSTAKYSATGKECEATLYTEEQLFDLLHWHENEGRSFAWIAIHMVRPTWEVEAQYNQVIEELEFSEKGYFQ